MEFKAKVYDLLLSEDSENALRELIKELLDKGYAKDEILAQFEQIHGELMEQEREKEDEIILNVLDYLTGWSSPHMVL